MPFTIATWNINSVRLREALVSRLMAEEAPDILCLQECKSPVENIPMAQFQALGTRGCQHLLRRACAAAQVQARRIALEPGHGPQADTVQLERLAGDGGGAGKGHALDLDRRGGTRSRADNERSRGSEQQATAGKQGSEHHGRKCERSPVNAPPACSDDRGC